ncbi:hypothetical protein SASPL_116181 [Salvia splendens]|uniref:Uncharacterized protein n=1 Tax=Salvia splendens TaxID=180675 RepID=A0A8X8ZV59_SALSN|nr:hypothetical protein SASPL_116181 [Salvia splendens]
MANSGPVIEPLEAAPMHPGKGPVIGVLVVITILRAIAVMIGRLCSGRGIRGHARYDFEKWVETICASCIDGGLDPPPPRVVPNHPHPQTQKQQQHD